MTRRQIYFFVPDTNTYYISEEFNGDKTEMERFASSDSCSKTWEEFISDLNGVKTLTEFMETVAKIKRCYSSHLSSEIPGTHIIVKHSKNDLECKDETYGIIAGQPGVFLDREFSIVK